MLYVIFTLLLLYSDSLTTNRVAVEGDILSVLNYLTLRLLMSYIYIYMTLVV
jgi:hypothetical protein